MSVLTVSYSPTWLILLSFKRVDDCKIELLLLQVKTGSRGSYFCSLLMIKPQK